MQAPLPRGAKAGFRRAPLGAAATGSLCKASRGTVGEGFRYIPYNKSLTALARANRNNPTPAESAIWNGVLRHRQFAGYKFSRQKPLGNYIVDFYCAELGLVIEIDGDSHAMQEEYDAERSRFLNGAGLLVVRFANRDVLQNLAGVFDDLQRRIDAIPRSRGSPRASCPSSS